MAPNSHGQGARIPRPPLHERWLRDPRRRFLIVLAITLGIAALSTRVWLDVASERGADLADTAGFFGRQVLGWGLWLIWAEPIARLASWSARRLRNPLLLAGFHVLLALGFATGITAVKLEFRDLFFPRPPWAAERERGRDAGQDSSALLVDEGEPGLESGLQAGVDPVADPESGPGPESEQRARADSGRRSGSGRRGRASWRTPERLRTASTYLGLAVYGGLLALGAGVGAFLKQRDEERRTLGLELRAAELESELAHAELANLSRQVHPHFLFNALHAITALVQSGERDVAVRALSDLGELLRRALEGGAQQTVELSSELELVERYLDLERLRLGERLRVRIATEPGTATVRVPTLAVLSLVENAVKHAIAPREEGGEVSVSVRRDGGRLLVVVEDDGPGFAGSAALQGGPDSASEAGARIGLENTRRRLAALYGSDAGLSIADRLGGGARVILWIRDEGGA